jgi:predicted phage tail protein
MDDLNKLPEITGAKGGGGSVQNVVQNVTVVAPTRGSVEEANNLFSVAFAKTVYALGEGEIEGFPNSATRDIFLDSTPIQNPDGTFNFSGYTIDSRTGTDETQTPMLGFSTTENTVGVNTAVTTAIGTISRTIDDTDTERCRVIISHPALQSQNAENGDISSTSVTYRISVRPQGSAVDTIVAEPTVSGKSNSQFQRAYEFDLPGSGPWIIKVTRLTPDSDNVYLQNSIIWQSYAEIIDEKFAYPNTALIGIKIDARQFNSIPDMSVRLRGKRVQIPTNYNPVTRTYNGIWDGTFTTAWTDNPAWIFRDIVLNPRFGCARYMPTIAIDPWYLYTVSQYCDQLVDDGNGGTEPRFTCNVYLQNPGGVYEVLNALASCFRGLVYYSQGKLYLTQDRQQLPVQQFSEANVIQEVDDNGNVTAPCFNYTGTAKTARKSVVLANWDDPNQSYSSVTEYLQDDQLLEKFGYNPIDLRLVGVTSRGQALRAAKHTLFSNRYETEKVSFRIGAEGLAASVGEVIKIADPLKQGQRLGGRILAINGNNITIDAVLNLDRNINYTLTLVIPDGETITNPDGSTQTTPRLSTYSIVDYTDTEIGVEEYSLVTQSLFALTTQDGTIIGGLIATDRPGNTILELNGIVDTQVSALWVLEWNTAQAALYKIIAIAEVDPLVFQVEAIQYNASKYGYVDNDLPIAIPKDRFTLSAPQVVTNLSASLVFNNNRTQISAKWVTPQINNADNLTIRNYRYQWREVNATQWSEMLTVTSTNASISLPDHLFGNAYQLRVATTDRLGRQSDFVTVDVAAFEPIPDLSDPTYNAVVRHANQPDGTQLVIVDSGTCPIPERVTGYRIELLPVNVPTVIPGVKSPQVDGYYFYSDIPLTGYKTVAFHAPGDWRVRVSFTSAIFGEAPTDYLYHDIEREEIVPPTPSNFSVVENSDRSGKRFSWQLPLSNYGSWDQGVISDIVGYEIRYKRGTLVNNDPSDTWDVGIELASGGLPAQQQWFETSLFDADEWVVMVKAVDATQWRTDVPGYVLVNIGAPLISNAVQSIDASTSGTWNGNYVNCQVNGSNELEQIDETQDSYFTWSFDNNNLESALLLTTTTNATYQHSLTALTGEAVVLLQEDDGQLLQEDDGQIIGEQRYYSPGELSEGGILHPYAPYEKLLGDVYRVQTLFKSPDGTTKGVITGLTGQLDYPDVIESLNDVAVSSSGTGTAINLTKTFRAISSVQVTLQNTSAVTAVVLAKTTSAITVVCRDASGTAVSGTVDLVVTGY